MVKERKVSVRFTQPYRGVLTDEVYYEKDEIAEFSPDRAMALVEAGRAEYVRPPRGAKTNAKDE